MQYPIIRIVPLKYEVIQKREFGKQRVCKRLETIKGGQTYGR